MDCQPLHWRISGLSVTAWSLQYGMRDVDRRGHVIAHSLLLSPLFLKIGDMPPFSLKVRLSGKTETKNDTLSFFDKIRILELVPCRLPFQKNLRLAGVSERLKIAHWQQQLSS